MKGMFSDELAVTFPVTYEGKKTLSCFVPKENVVQEPGKTTGLTKLVSAVNMGDFSVIALHDDGSYSEFSVPTSEVVYNKS
jgi:hypothetical protein